MPYISKLATSLGVATASLTFTALNASRSVAAESVGFGTGLVGIVLKEGTRFVAGDIPAEIVSAASQIVTANAKMATDKGMLLTAVASAAAVGVGTIIIVTSAELLVIAATKPVVRAIRYIKTPKRLEEHECCFDIEEFDLDYDIINIYHVPEEHENQFIEDAVII